MLSHTPNLLRRWICQIIVAIRMEGFACAWKGSRSPADPPLGVPACERLGHWDGLKRETGGLSSTDKAAVQVAFTFAGLSALSSTVEQDTRRKESMHIKNCKNAPKYHSHGFHGPPTG